MMNMTAPSAATLKEGYIAAAFLIIVTLVMALAGATIAALVVIDLLFVTICWIIIASRATDRARLAKVAAPAASEAPKAV